MRRSSCRHNTLSWCAGRTVASLPVVSRFFLPLVTTTVLFSLAAVALADDDQAADDDKASVSGVGRLFEMRVYTTAEGKLPNLHERFCDHTNRLFVKHGMSLIAYWTPEDKPNTLIYVLAYPNRAARDASWKAFMGDSDWKQVWAASKQKAGGPIVTKVESTFMNATDYSPIH